MTEMTEQENAGIDPADLLHAKRALNHLSYFPTTQEIVLLCWKDVKVIFIVSLSLCNSYVIGLWIQWSSYKQMWYPFFQEEWAQKHMQWGWLAQLVRAWC